MLRVRATKNFTEASIFIFIFFPLATRDALLHSQHRRSFPQAESWLTVLLLAMRIAPCRTKARKKEPKQVSHMAHLFNLVNAKKPGTWRT